MSNVWVPYFTWELMFVFIVENHSRQWARQRGTAQHRGSGGAIRLHWMREPMTTSGDLASGRGERAVPL